MTVSTNIPRKDPIGNLTSILDLVKGKSSTSTSTTSSNISSEGVDALIKQILSGTQGLAAVSGGQKSAGLYNSTTNQQLINDLITRTSGEVALRQAGTTTTQTNRTNPALSGSNIISMLGSAGINKLVKSGAKAGGKKLLQSETGAGLAESLGIGTGVGNAVEAGGSLIGSDATAQLVTSANATADPLSTFLGSLGYDAGGIAGSLGAGALDGIASGSFGLDALGASLFGDGAAGFAGATGVGAGIGGSTAAIDLGAEAAFGADLGGLFSAGSAAAGGAELAGFAETAAVASEAGGVGEAILAAIAFWIICTELKTQGRLPKRFYVHGMKVFQTYPKDKLKGYYVWAIPTVRHLRAHPYSFYSRFICAIFNWRAEYLAALAGCKGARKTFKGWAVTKISYGFCYALSYFVPEQVPEVLYGHN